MEHLKGQHKKHSEQITFSIMTFSMTQHHYSQPDNNTNATLSLITLSIMTFRIMTEHNYTQHNNKTNVTPSIMTLSITKRSI